MSEQAITEFLEARIAEDEQLARDAIADDMGQDGGFEDAFDKLTKLVPGGFLPRFGEAAARMIVWNTPRRVLSECAAKRAIIELHPVYIYTDEEPGFEVELSNHVCPSGAKPVMGACNTLRALAAVYSGHPNYLPAWAL